MCSEVMYGAYYPYLYGRAGPSRPFYQYDRFNQDLYPSAAGVPIAASTSTSASSNSPCSPLLPPSLSSSSSNTALASALAPSSIPLAGSLGHQRNIAKEEVSSVPRNETEATLPGGNHNDSSSCSSGPESPNGQADGRTQYISATCVVVTHYSGDVASVVDEHFTRALNFNDKTSKESNPMSARNFPASFWNSNYVPPAPAIPTHHHQMSDLYSSESGIYSTEPWVHNAAHYGSYAAHAYHHNMAQYGSLLRLPQQYGHSSRLHHDQQTAHALESAAAAYSNYPMSGLEAQVQESSKDLYWF